MVCLEELVGEVLCHEGKHQIGSLGVRPEFGSLKETLSQLFGIRKHWFTCKDRWSWNHMICCLVLIWIICLICNPTFSSHWQRAAFRHRREEPGVVGDVVVGLPAEVSIFGIVGRRAWNKVTSDFGKRREWELF